MNQTNKQLLDQFATIENDLANKEDENKVMAKKFVEINLILEKISTMTTSGDQPISAEISTCLAEIEEILQSDFSVRRSRIDTVSD